MQTLARMPARRALGALAVALVAAAPALAEPAAAKAPVLRLRAFAVDTNVPGAASAARTLDIVIERWSTAAERDRLRDALVEKRDGSALLAAAQAIRPRAGYVRGPSSLGWDIPFAAEVPLPGGGRRIVIGSDRPMSFWELASQARSSEYEFMLAEIRLGPDGKGGGKLVPAAKIRYDEDRKAIEIENWEATPVRLNQVKVVP